MAEQVAHVAARAVLAWGTGDREGFVRIVGACESPLILFAELASLVAALLQAQHGEKWVDVANMAALSLSIDDAVNGEPEDYDADEYEDGEPEDGGDS